MRLERTRPTARSANHWAINGRRSDPVDPLAASRNPSPSHGIFDLTSRDGARDTRPMSEYVDGRLGIAPWEPGEKDRWVRITPTEVLGRTFERTRADGS